MKVARYSFCFVLIFTISLVMMISGSTDALGNHTDCTLKSTPTWDKKIERGDEFKITWDNPSGNANSSHCIYDIFFYHDKKTPTGTENSGAKDSWSASWDSIGIKYFKICPANDYVCKSNSEFYSFELVNTSIDCTLKSIPSWDKIVHPDKITIIWNNPDLKNCRYDVSFYNKDLTNAGGKSEDAINNIKISWTNGVGDKFFQICPTNVNDADCKSKLHRFTLQEYNQNHIVIVIAVIVVTMAIIIGIKIKNKGSKKSKVPSSTPASSTPASSTAVPASTEKPQEENITDIDKQIAINEEKIRKMEEESKKLDEEGDL
jgi:hypothetical protein